MSLLIPIILGTARKGRQSEKVAEYVFEKVRDYGADTEIIDVRDYRIAATDNTQEIPKAKKLKPKIEKADGFIIVSPEYNHGYPGELKMMLDMLYGQFHNKPVGICGVSASAVGGARMAEVLRISCIEFHMVPIREAVYFPKVHELFDKRGNIKDKKYDDIIKNFLEELTWYAKKLKQ